jgi:tetratricopeptide (TPR) repeat protein
VIVKSIECRTLILATGLLLLAVTVGAAPATLDDARDLQVRQRYEQVVLKNPFQERAFNQVYDGYTKVEGVDKWVEALKPKVDGEDGLAALLLLGQIYDRQFKATEAIAAFEKAAAKGESRPQFKILLGTLYYKNGRDEKAAELLNAALDTAIDLDQRSAICRMLGNLYLRQGKRDQAVTVWKRISEQNPGEVFSQLELAEIYEDNRMWNDAIAVYQRIAELAKDDPYRRCRALRSIGHCLVQAEKFKDAIATYEQALELVAPGNWLFEDLKLRLVGVYEDIGDLAGLVKYVTAKLELNQGDLEFRDLLAETYARMARFDDAEKQYRAIVERNPKNTTPYEKLIGLYTRTARKADVVASFEKLIELFPADSEYLRRLGEFQLRDGNPEKAKETWRRLTKEAATAEKVAQLAGWFETYEFIDDAIAGYQEALGKGKNKEWILRLAALKFQKGDEPEAIKLWQSVIDSNNSKVEDYSEVASILESYQKFDEALKLRKAAVDKETSNFDNRLAYAKLLVRQKKLDEALIEFESLANQDKNEYLMQQGENGRLDVWRELGLLEEKQKQLESDLTANPSDAKKLSQLARLYERGGQRDKAITLYEARREKEPETIEYLRTLAGLYKNAKQTEQAIANYKTLLEKDKNRARVYQKELLEIYLSVDLKGEAMAAGEALVSLAPSDPEVRLTLAQVYQLYRQPEKALNEYRFALRLEPNEPDYHRQYGEALEAEKRYGEAQEAFRKMLDVAKEDATRLSAVGSLARIHLQQDRLPELVTEFQRRIRNTPKKLAAYEELAAIYKESGQIFRGIEVLENGLQNVDDKSAVLKSLIRVGHEAQDFPKVKSYFEQLVEISGKPTANEYERLGQIYGQLGEIEKAKASWNNILKAAPKDPKAHDRVAKLLQDQGFSDEALAVKSKAVELDVGDYKRRFEYAQLLAQNQQPVQAMEQVRLLLEIGEREQKKDDKESEKKVQRVSRNQQNQASAYQFMYGGRYSGARYFGAGWQGNFKDFRPAVLQFMATLAQQSIGEDAFVEQLQERVKKPGASGEMRLDLLTVLQMFNRMDEAVKLAEDLLAGAPNDPELLQTTALLYSNQQQLDKAIPVLERIAKTQPKQRLTAASGLVPLYFKNKEEAKALALVDDLLKENPTDIQVYYMMSSMLQNNGKFEEAKRVALKLREIDPLQADQVRNLLAGIARQSSKPEEALDLYRESLFAEAARPAYFATSRRIDIYLPELEQNRARMYSNPLQALPPQAFGNWPWAKVLSLGELKVAAKSGTDKATNVFAEMESIAVGWSPSLTPAQRDRAWDMARLLIGNHIVEKEFDKAGQILEKMRKAGFEEASWFNISIYLAQQREDYDAMVRLYDELQQRYPAKARDIAIARTHTHLIAKKYGEAAKVIRNLNEQRVPPAQILNLIGQLQRVGEKKLAKQLLEEHLGGVSRNSQALSMLASLAADENDFEKSITLANEAWERKAHGAQGGGSSYFYGGGFYGGYSPYMPRFGQVDNLLNELHRYYVGAGKSDELLTRFKQVLEKQPGSVQAHENLAALYRASDQREKALEIYQQLAEKRPHLMQVKRNIASLYQEMGQFDKATKFYEDLIKSSPNLYDSFQWELRSAYQRQGKGKELQTMESNIAAKARDPNQLMQLGYRFREDGELEKAADMFRKAVKMSPGQGHMQNQLAAVLVEMGQLDQAVKAYEEWFNSPQLRGQSWVDHQSLSQLAGLYKATGKLDDLKKRCDADLQKNSADRTARALQVHIAFLEKRYDDALNGFKGMISAGNDPNLVNQLITLASYSGNFKEILEVAERADASVSGANWNAQQLASLYLAAGDKKKAAGQQLKWAEQMIQQGNGSWALRETMQQLTQMDLWDETEQFVAKHRTDTMDQWEADEFDRTIAQRYINEGRFESVVKPLLTKESLKGRDLSLVQKIVEQYQYANQSAKRRSFLEKLVAADPKNRDLAFGLAQLYVRAEDLPNRLTLIQTLVEADPNKADYRRALVETLIELGRAEEALTSLAAWVKEKSGEQRWILLSQMQARAGRIQDARESLAKAVEVADKVRKTDLQIQLANFETQRGDASIEKAALKENFLAKKDARSFQSYSRFLENNGWAAEAHALFVTNRDNGYFDQYQQNDFVALCLNQSDYASAADLNWRFTRYGNRWERDWYFDRVAKVYRDRGKLGWFVTDFAKRVEQDAAVNESLWERVARSWEQAGAPEKAVAIYDRQLQTNPFNRNAAQNKANLLIKLGRPDDALALLRDPKGITGLEQESNAKVALIETLFKIGRKAEAESEIDALLAWDKLPKTLMRVGNILMDQRDYAKAAGLFEKATSGIRDWNYDELLQSLAKCRAKLGKVGDLAKLTDELMRSNNGEWRLQTLQSWLSSEGFHDLAAKVIQSRLGKSPERLELHTALAAALEESGRTADAIDTYESAAKSLAPERLPEIRSSLAGFIMERDRLSEALKIREVKPTPLLENAIIEVFARSDEKSERFKRLAESADKFKTDDPDLQTKLAAALVKLKRLDSAAALYRNALKSTNEMQRVNAAVALARLNGDKAAAPVLADALKNKPHWFAGSEIAVQVSHDTTVFYGPGSVPATPYNPLSHSGIDGESLIAALAKLGDAELLEQLTQTFAVATLHVAERDYYQALVIYHQGQTNEARVKLAALADAPKLSAARLQRIAKLLDELGGNPERSKILHRLMSGGYPAQARWDALAELVKLHSKAGQFKPALAALSQMHGVWGMAYCEEARATLADAVMSENLAAFKSLLLEIVRARPTDDAVSNLLGLYQQIAQRFGKEEVAAKLAAEANVADMERDEAAAWDGLVEEWEIAGPFRSLGNEISHGPSYGPVQAGATQTLAEPTIPQNTTWRSTNPQRELGVIRVGAVLGLSTQETAGQFAYARTTLSSAEERRVTLCLGSDDSVRVWVNGELVHSYTEARSLALDQDRIPVTFKKGANKILMKIGNNTDAWSFAFRVAPENERFVSVRQ